MKSVYSNMRVTLARPGDGVLINRKWVILHEVSTELSPSSGSTRLRGHYVSNGVYEPVELTVPSHWTITVSQDRSADKAVAR